MLEKTKPVCGDIKKLFKLNQKEIKTTKPHVVLK